MRVNSQATPLTKVQEANLHRPKFNLSVNNQLYGEFQKDNPLY